MNQVGASSSFAVGAVKIFFVLSILFSSLYFSQVFAGSSPPPPPPIATPTISPGGGGFQNQVSVSVTGNTEIRYTLNGSTPNENSPTYSGSLPLNTTTTLKARGVRASTVCPWGQCTTTYTWGSTATATFSFSVSQPSVSTPGGTYANPVSVSLATATSGATIRCTTNGTVPNASSPVCSTLGITQSTTLKAIAFKTGLNNSSMLTQTYNINTEPAILTPTDGTTLTGSSATVTWEADGVVPDYWQVNVGSTPRTYDVTYSSMLPSNASQATLIDLPIDGRTLYFQLYTRNNGGWTLVDEKEYIAAGRINGVRLELNY